MGRYKIYTNSPKPLLNVPTRTKQRLLKRTIIGPDFGRRGLPFQTADETRSENFQGDENAIPSGFDQTMDAGDFDKNVLDSEIPNDDQNDTSSESSGDSDCDDEEARVNLSEKLYPDARITAEESTLLLLAFIHRHNLTKEATEDLQELVQFHLPVSSTIPKSNYMLKKHIRSDRFSWERHYYCAAGDCLVYLGSDPSSKYCVQCTQARRQPEADCENYFIFANCGEIISEVLERNAKHILDSRNSSRPASVFCDIVDGECYKKLKKSKLDLTGTINTDGISPFHSSNFQLWPVFISINELPYKIRRTNCILVALWFGNSKPNFQTYLNPVIKALNEFGDVGITWQFKGKKFNSKIYFPLLVCDSPARSSVQGMIQYNGMFSCPTCLHPGETHWITETSHKTIMPLLNPPPTLRTREGFLDHLRELQEKLKNGRNIKSHYGIIEASQLLLLRSFNIIEGIGFDYMHSALLGVVRYFSIAWFDSKNSQEAYYVGGKISELDGMSKNVTVPTNLSRPLRKVSQMCYWKAHEWRQWMIVGPILLKGVLPDQYRNHFSKFCKAFLLLLGEMVTQDNISTADRLLHDFAYAVLGLYGKRFYTYNLHVSLHAPSTVKRWGPLWCFSAFQFENENGRIIRLMNGTKNVAAEISVKLADEFALKKLSKNAFGASNETREFFNSLIQNRKFFRTAMKVEDFVCVGCSKTYTFTSQEMNKLAQQNLVGFPEAKVFKKVIYKGVIFCVKKPKPTRFSDHVLSISGQLYIIQGFLVIPCTPVSNMVLLLNKINCVDVASLTNTFKVTSVSESPILLRPTGNIALSKFIIIYSFNDAMSYICKLPNITELD